MATKLLIELSPAAEAALRELMERYGEPTPEAMMSRALGFLQAVKGYVDKDGVLVIRKPDEPGGDEGLVEFQFENAAKHAEVFA